MANVSQCYETLELLSPFADFLATIKLSVLPFNCLNIFCGQGAAVFTAYSGALREHFRLTL